MPSNIPIVGINKIILYPTVVGLYKICPKNCSTVPIYFLVFFKYCIYLEGTSRPVGLPLLPSLDGFTGASGVADLGANCVGDIGVVCVANLDIVCIVEVGAGVGAAVTPLSKIVLLCKS